MQHQREVEVYSDIVEKATYQRPPGHAKVARVNGSTVDIELPGSSQLKRGVAAPRGLQAGETVRIEWRGNEVAILGGSSSPPVHAASQATPPALASNRHTGGALNNSLTHYSPARLAEQRRTTQATLQPGYVPTSAFRAHGQQPATPDTLGHIRNGAGLLVDAEGIASVTPASIGAYTTAEANTAIAAAVTAHVGLSDPHTQYLPKAGGTMTGAFRAPAIMLGDSSAAPDSATGINSPNNSPLRWRNPAGTAYLTGFNYDANGYFTVANSAFVVQASSGRMHVGGVTNVQPSARLQATTTSATLPAFIAEGASGQTANILEVRQNATATPVFAIDDGGQIRTNQRVAATTPGSVTGKIEVFNGSGTSLGFIPVYDSIT